jgi:hypothetical protein
MLLLLLSNHGAASHFLYADALMFCVDHSILSMPTFHINMT